MTCQLAPLLSALYACLQSWSGNENDQTRIGQDLGGVPTHDAYPTLRIALWDGVSYRETHDDYATFASGAVHTSRGEFWEPA